MPNFQHNIILNGCFLAVIDGDKCTTADSFYKEISNAMNFPGNFGHNLDALDEMMSDLEWIEEKTIALIIINHANLLMENKEMLTVVNGIFFRATVELENFKIHFSVHTQKL